MVTITIPDTVAEMTEKGFMGSVNPWGDLPTLALAIIDMNLEKWGCESLDDFVLQAIVEKYERHMKETASDGENRTH